MTDLPAYCFYREFDAEPQKEIQFDRHYLLYAAKGSIRFETENKSWVLPPSRAAWIAANKPILMHCTQPLTCCSILYSTDFIDPPANDFSVFNVTSLAREMILECRKWGPETEKLTDDALQFFGTLANVCKNLATTPSETWLPTGQSIDLKRALKFTSDNLDQNITFSDVANAAGASPRTLARRFSEETNHTWRQLQRRMRMIAAVERLSEGSSNITYVAMDVGYNSVSAFNSAFKAFTGQSPGDFRKSL